MPHGPEIHPPANRVALQRLSQAAELAVWRDPPCQASPTLLRLPGSIPAAGKTVQGRDPARYIARSRRIPGFVVVGTIPGWLAGNTRALERTSGNRQPPRSRCDRRRLAA